ncbi:superoxide dismutase family protein [Antrihabitans cavernicola]|uniref:Superoxide dismutase family protein n=1 Tax=Antrihabitans cavernicola TaxID=2495913 RepID=A0A5A7S0F5_9NOCA|nr:superoxide dismutase family protein [Spelaeibacter cavernicola]KAA0015874.1 superoxide dismutase family protein [Spelaeibacter cavernicola]
MKKIVHRFGCAIAGAALAVAVGGCSNGQEPSSIEGTTPAIWTGKPMPPTHGEVADPGHEPGGFSMAAGLADRDGNPSGTVTFVEQFQNVGAQIDVLGLPMGDYGVRVHEFGKCEPHPTDPVGDFMSAGDVLRLGGSRSEKPSGDLTTIHVREDGVGRLITSTSAFTIDDLRNNGNGRAVIVHAGPGSGPRLACAVVR